MLWIEYSSFNASLDQSDLMGKRGCILYVEVDVISSGEFSYLNLKFPGKSFIPLQWFLIPFPIVNCIFLSVIFLI